jgi:hypothetical protein
LKDRTTARAFSGLWRITSTESWDTDALDLVQPAYITFDDESVGSFGMIVISAGIDCRFAMRDGKPLVEFTFALATTTGIRVLVARGASSRTMGRCEAGCSFIAATIQASSRSVRVQ